MKISAEELKGIAKIMTIINILKCEARAGWNREARGEYEATSVENAESVADHTLGVVFVSMVMATLLNLDVKKAMTIALIHDLPEALTGDKITATEKGRARLEEEKETEERFAIRTIFYNLPDSLGGYLFKLFREYQTLSSPEAELVYQLDKIETVKQAFDYYNGGEKVNPYEFLESYKDRMKDFELKQLLEITTKLL